MSPSVSKIDSKAQDAAKNTFCIEIDLHRNTAFSDWVGSLYSLEPAWVMGLLGMENHIDGSWVRRAIATKAPLRVQFLLTFFGGRGEEQEASALLSKKGGREGSIESQQKFDFFSYDDTPYLERWWNFNWHT